MDSPEYLQVYAAHHAKKFHVDSFRYGVAIYRHRLSHYGGDAFCVMKWDGLSFAQANKYDWYFRYRAALFQIETPQQFIEIRKWNYPHVDPVKVQLLRLQNKLIAAKGAVTKIEGQLTLARNNWNALFPIEEEPLWGKAQEKLERKRKEVREIEEEITSLQNQSK